MIVFIKYDRKYPYLPVAIADSKAELARLLGMKLNVVESCYSHKISTFAEVEIDDEDCFLKKGELGGKQ